MYFNETLCQIKMSQISVSSTPDFGAARGHTVLITFLQFAVQLHLVLGAFPDSSEPLVETLPERKDEWRPAKEGWKGEPRLAVVGHRWTYLYTWPLALTG